MRVNLTGLVLLAACSSAASADVPIMNLYANPLAYEGKIVITCGRAPVRGSLLFLGRTMGRSPLALRLDRVIDSRSGCIQAKLVRMSPAEAATMAHDEALVADGPRTPPGWRLKVIRVDPH